MPPETHELTVEYVPPSVNNMLGRHWSEAYRVKKVCTQAVWVAWLEAGKPLAEGRRASVQVTIEAYGQADDEDNRLARLKPLFDGMVKLGILVDDSPAWCSQAVPKHRSGARRTHTCHVTITYHER